MLRYHEQERFNWDYEQALNLWQLSHGTVLKMNPAEEARFTVWFIHDYRLSYGKTLLELFCDEKHHALASWEREILETWMASTLGLFEVERIEEGVGVGLNDLHTGKKCFAYDVSASRGLTKWDILIARVTEAGDFPGLEGAAVVYPHHQKETLMDLVTDLYRDYMRRNPGASWREFMKKEGYRLNVSSSVIDKTFKEKKVLTAEGDELVFSEAVYQVKDFEKVHAALEAVEAFIREDDEAGDVHAYEVNYKWATQVEDEPKPEGGGQQGLILHIDVNDLEGGSLRSLGDITLTREHLKLECLSKKRLAKGKKLIREALGGLVKHSHTSYQEVDDALKQREKEAPKRETKADVITSDEDRRVYSLFLENHYRKWLDKPIPSLRGMTPREASKTGEGRALLEETLKTLENNELRRLRKEGFFYNVDKLRMELRL